MTADQLAIVGAFLSGVGSALTATFAIRREHKRMEHECAERIELFREGIRLERER